MNNKRIYDQISFLEMRIQTVNIYIGHGPADFRAEVHAALTNIARGSCVLSVTPNEETRKHVGSLVILADRPMMLGDLHLGRFQFERLLTQFRGPHPGL